MVVKQSWFYITCLCFTLSETFSVDSLPKCNLKDSECQKDLYQNVIKDLGQTGIPELNMPKMDPMALKNVAVTVPEVANLTLVEGVAKGIKNCVVNVYEVDFDKGFAKQELTCDITIKGRYKILGESEFLKRILGNAGVQGDGNGKVKLEKVVIKMKYPFYPKKHDDGNIFFTIDDKGIEYDFDIKGKATFAADNIFLGKVDITEFVVKYLNENWKYVLKTFGKVFVDKAMEYYLDFAKKFFSGIPAKQYIVDDLTPYLRA